MYERPSTQLREQNSWPQNEQSLASLSDTCRGSLGMAVQSGNLCRFTRQSVNQQLPAYASLGHSRSKEPTPRKHVSGNCFAHCARLIPPSKVTQIIREIVFRMWALHENSPNKEEILKITYCEKALN